MSKMEKQIETMKSDAAYVKAKVEIYVRALQQIAKASDQDNPIALRNRARIALEQEPTTADKVNEMNEAIKSTPEYQVGKKIFGGDTGIDADHDNEAQLAMDDIKIREDAEAAWRDTILHPEYKSEYEEEE